jgi:hypothetical protein
MLRVVTTFKGHYNLGAVRAYNEASRFLDLTRTTFPKQNNSSTSMVLSPCYNFVESHHTIVLTCWNSKADYIRFFDNYLPSVTDTGTNLYQIESRYYHVNSIKRNIPLL